MANKLEYTLSLRDRLTGPLTRIVEVAGRMGNTWTKVRQKAAGADAALAQCAKNLDSLRQQAAGKPTNPLWLVRKGIEAADNGLQGAARTSDSTVAQGTSSAQAAPQQTLQSRIDRLASQAQDAMAPAFEGIGRMLGTVVTWFEQHGGEMLEILRTVAQVAGRAFDIAGRAIEGALGWLSGWLNALREGNLPVIALTALVGSLAGILSVCALWEGVVTKAKWAWNTAQQAVNLSLLACPLTWLVAGIVALAAVIGYVAYSTTGWGETWTNTWEYIKLSFQQAGAWMELKWLQTQNIFLTGFELIEKGWYKLQSLWDKDSANAGLARIESARDQRAAEIAKAQGKVEGLAQKRRELDVWQIKSNGKTPGDAVRDLKTSLGLETPAAAPGGLLAGTTNTDNAFGPEPGNAAITAIAGSGAGGMGGGRSSSVTINLQSLVGNLVFEGGYDENREAMQQDLESALIRVLEIANTAQ